MKHENHICIAQNLHVELTTRLSMQQNYIQAIHVILVENTLNSYGSHFEIDYLLRDWVIVSKGTSRNLVMFDSRPYI